MRECGSCHLCCDLLEVKIFDKPENTRCKYLTHNCSIHPTRPEVCRNFFCGWAKGLMPESLPPYKSHILVEVLSEDIILVTVDPNHSGEWQRGRVKEELEKFIEEGYAVIIRDGNAKFMKAPEGRDLLEVAKEVKQIAVDMGVI